jgi:Domain of unknown function (DUF397)
MTPQSRGWFKSSFSASANQGCVVIRFINGLVQVRDSKIVNGPVLMFSRSEWEAFLLGAFAGEFEMPQ